MTQDGSHELEVGFGLQQYDERLNALIPSVEHGAPPEIFKGGKDTLAAYLLTRPGVNVNWVASFLGVDRVKVDRYVSWVEDRAATIRERARKQGIE